MTMRKCFVALAAVTLLLGTVGFHLRKPATTAFAAAIPSTIEQATSCTSTHTTLSPAENSIVTQNNALRASHGLQPLVVSTALNKAAAMQSTTMATTGVFAHDTYTNTLARIQSCGNAATTIDENIAGGNADATATFSQWQNSPEHLANMLDSRMAAVGVSEVNGIYVDSSGTTWGLPLPGTFPLWTADFSDVVDQGGGGGGTLTAHVSAPTAATVNTAVTITASGTGNVGALYYYVIYGDGAAAPGWQTSPTFSHTYTSTGSFTVSGYVYDTGRSTGQQAGPVTQAITVSTSGPPAGTCHSAYYNASNVLSQGAVIACP